MNVRSTMAFAIIAVLFVAPAWAAETSNGKNVSADTGEKQGAGTGGGRGRHVGGRDTCGDGIFLRAGKEVRWHRSDVEIDAREAAGRVQYGTNRELPGVPLAALLADEKDFASVFVASCGQQGFSVKRMQLKYAKLFLVRGNGGRWKLVDLVDPTTPTILVHNVARIELAPNESEEEAGPGRSN